MNPGLISLLAGIAGFAVGALIPTKPTTDSQQSIADTKASQRPEFSRKKGLSRMELLTEMASKLSRSEWPAFFRARLHSPQDTRLAARLWAEADPAGFWAWLRESRDRDQLDSFSEELLLIWSGQDPEAAMDAVMAITDKDLSDRLRMAVIDTVLDQDFELGMAFAARAGSFNGFSNGPTSWIWNDPGLATSKLIELPAHSAYRFYLDHALQEWARKDPATCLAWLSKNPPIEGEDSRSNWLTVGFKTVAFSNPGEALDAALLLRDSAHRSQALAGVVASGKLSLEEVVPLLDQIGLNEKYGMAWEIGGFDQEGNFANRAGILDLIPANQNSHNGYRRIAADWSKEDPAAAWEWASSIEDPVQSRVAISAMVENLDAGQLDAVAELPFHALSDLILGKALTRIPEDQREAWIDRMPDDRADWTRRIAAGP